ALIKAAESVESFFKKLDYSNELSFAFICGVLNGVIEFLAGIVDIILLIVEFLLNRVLEGYSAEDEIAVKNLIEVLENFSEEFIKDPNFLIKGMISTAAGYFGKRYGETSDDYEKAYHAGEDLVL